jgi:hypothetical protein
MESITAARLRLHAATNEFIDNTINKAWEENPPPFMQDR